LSASSKISTRCWRTDPPNVVGISSGGALALEAAAACLAIDRLVVYEVPYNLDPGWPAHWRAYVDELHALLAACLGDGRVPTRFATISQPPLIVTGQRDGPEWVRALAPAADRLAATVQNGRRHLLPTPSTSPTRLPSVPSSRTSSRSEQLSQAAGRDRRLAESRCRPSTDGGRRPRRGAIRTAPRGRPRAATVAGSRCTEPRLADHPRAGSSFSNRTDASRISQIATIRHVCAASDQGA
jgi:hypothetical protein